MKAGDAFFYSHWGGKCLVSFVDGILVVNREGTNADGINTWKCKSVADTIDLLNGKVANINWDNKEGVGDKMMVMTDDNTFTRPNTTYSFTRMNPKTSPSSKRSVSCRQILL